MANSGYTDVKVTNWDTLRFRWEVGSQSITSNSTTVKWALELIAASNGRISATSTQSWSVTVNGQEYTGSSNVGIANNATKTLASGSTVVPHNSDGSKTFSYSFEQYFGITFSGVWITTKSGSGSGVLPNIARTSVPSVSKSSVDMGGSVTIYTNRQSTALTHDLAYSFAGGGYVAITTGVGASYTWTVPDLASKIPNAVSGVLTIRCITKNGSTTVGTSTVAITVNVPGSVLPTISDVTVAEATDGLAAQFGAYIQNKSTLAVAIKAAGAKGSTISNYSTVVNGMGTYDGQSITTAVLQYSGERELTVYVTDSRGRVASKTIKITVLEYSPPSTSEFKAFRCDATGTPLDDGVYLGLSYAYRVEPLGGKNTAGMVIEYKRSTRSDYEGTVATGSDLEGSGIRFFTTPTFSTDYQYDIRMTVTDWFGASTSYTVRLSAADVILDISADGTGLGIGKVSQRPGVTEFGREMRDRFDTRIGNGLAVYTGSGTNAIDPNTTLEPLIVTDKNVPARQYYYHYAKDSLPFWYVFTQFYSTKSVDANRVQYALPYSTPDSFWLRTFLNGEWSDWTQTPAKTGEWDLGIWHIVTWSDGRVELTGTYEINNLACNTALGNWYRTAVFTPGYFPLELDGPPTVTVAYESDGYGAMLWATTEASAWNTASYYLIRPTSTTIASGKVVMRVAGHLKN